MTKPKPKHAGGRPPKPPGEKFKTTQRQFGRISDEDWELLQSAAKAAGLPFTQWAKGLLLKAAKRQISPEKNQN
jgi:hypothetical protein